MPQVGELTIVPCQSCGVEMECEPLILNGLPLTPTYCDDCCESYQQRRDDEEREEADKERQAEIQKHIEAFRKICPAKKWQLDPDLFPSSIEAARSCVRLTAKGNSLLIHGESRIGKSVTAWQCCRKWVEMGRRVKVVRHVEFGRLIEKSYSGAGLNHDELIGAFSHVALLFIDDLGKDKITERSEADLFDVIDYRTDHDLPILITTQFVGETFLQRFKCRETGVAISERLKESCETVNLSNI